MKLIYCNECHDVISLRFEDRTCDCGKSGGKYLDRLNAEIYGPCIPLGFAGKSFRDARENQPETNENGGALFTAFVIEKQCPTIQRRNENGNVTED